MKKKLLRLSYDKQTSPYYTLKDFCVKLIKVLATSLYMVIYFTYIIKSNCLSTWCKN